LYNGVFLIIERPVVSEWFERQPRVLSHLYALLVVMVGWVFFRAETLRDALGYLQAMAGLGHSHAPKALLMTHFTSDVQLAVLVGVASSFPWVKYLGARIDSMAMTAGKRAIMETAVNCGLLLMFLVALTQLAAGTYNPFIYFRF
jgi:alginate O-acetyltransferase complex protein AlgI